jgi:hypothetical protein
LLTNISSVGSYTTIDLLASAPGGRMLVVSSRPGAAFPSPWVSHADLLDARSGRSIRSFDLGSLGFEQQTAAITALNDGSVEFIGQDLSGPSGTHVVAHVGPGAAVRTRSLPAWSAYMSAEAIAPNGAVWQGLACSGQVARTDLDGSVHRYRVPRAGCGSGGPGATAEFDSSFVVGPNGSAWLANPCAGRISRIPLVGPLRSWRIRPDLAMCGYDITPTLARRVVATPDGGLRYPGGRIDASGKAIEIAGMPADATTRGGGQWTVGANRVVEQLPRSAPLTFSPTSSGERPADVLWWTIGPDGRLWYTAAEANGDSSGGWYGPVIGVLGGPGTPASRPFPAFAKDGGIDPGTAAGYIYDRSLVAAAPDGSVWVTGPGAGVDGTSPVVRVTPKPALRPARPRARAARAGARHAATQWLQLSCTSRPGTYCSGTVRLVGPRGRVLSSAARYAIAGGAGGSTSVKLTSAARSALRHGALRVTAVVKGGSGQPGSRTSLRIPRA